MVRLAAENGAALAGFDRTRRILLAKVHVAPKALGLAKEDYRAIVQRITGHASAADCTNVELAAIVAEFERLGFRSQAAAPRRAADHPIARKARALWISLHQIGAIGDPSERALEAFGRRQLGVDRLQWADQSHSDALIEALKAIADRHGWRQDGLTRLPAAERVRALKDRLVAVLLAKLAAHGAVQAGRIVGDRAGWGDGELDGAVRRLARLLRPFVAAGGGDGHP